jgi:uncharacterized protein (TIGR04255 family)
MHTIYKKNFLTDVIFKINFPLMIDLNKDVSSSFKDKISSLFPIIEPVKLSNIKLEATSKDLKTEREEITMWRFKDAEGKMIIELNADSLAVVTKSYINFSKFEELVLRITSNFLEVYGNTVINRFGLRYINQINLDEKNIYDWTKYINPSLIANIDFVEEKTSLRRAMTFMEIVIDDETKLRMQHGVFNRTYPGELLNKEFILDYDCFTEIQFNNDQLKEKINSFNDIITLYFEKTITDDFRKVLNVK